METISAASGGLEAAPAGAKVAPAGRPRFESGAEFRVRQCNELRVAREWLSSLEWRSFPGHVAAICAVDSELIRVQERVAELCEPWFEVAQ